MTQIKKYSKELQSLAPRFHCGNVFIDEFLKSDDSLNDGIGVTYVFLEDDYSRIIGYYNLGINCIRQVDGGRTRRI